MINDNAFGVLFVDDEEKALKYFERAFKSEFPIFKAASAAEGREILDQKADRIGVLITDQRMPEEKGVELLKYARKQHPQITRMLTTAYSDLEDAIEAVNSGEILRYVTKPWDIQILTTELRQAMQFFKLRRERDQLMGEKLNTWQRMDGVNRIRDILVMASGFTLTNNASHAAKSFIEQVPFKATKAKGANHWQELKLAIQAMQVTAAELAEQYKGKANNDFEPVDIKEIILSVAGNLGLQDKHKLTDPSPAKALNANSDLIQCLFESIFNYASSGSEEMISSVSQDEESVKIKVVTKGKVWEETSLTNAPTSLLSAFLASYHHAGELHVDGISDDEFSMTVSLPLDPSSIHLPTLDLAWLDEILVRFENW